jgi:carbonic anhydrase/acetyltransferase-like protein (isoleucine patch superfamily)
MFKRVASGEGALETCRMLHGGRTLVRRPLGSDGCKDDYHEHWEDAGGGPCEGLCLVGPPVMQVKDHQRQSRLLQMPPELLAYVESFGVEGALASTCTHAHQHSGLFSRHPRVNMGADCDAIDAQVQRAWASRWPCTVVFPSTELCARWSMHLSPLQGRISRLEVISNPDDVAQQLKLIEGCLEYQVPGSQLRLEVAFATEATGERWIAALGGRLDKIDLVFRGAGSFIVDDNSNAQLLDKLVKVDNHLYIYHDFNFTRLTTVRGDLGIFNSVSFASLTAVHGDLDVIRVRTLASFAGLASLSAVHGSLRIHHCKTLTSLAGLSSLTNIGGDLVIGGNSALVSLEGLSNLTNIGGNLVIEGNSALVSLKGLSGLTNLGGGLTIDNNSALVSLEGLSGLTTIKKDLIVSGCCQVSSFGELSLTLVKGSLGIYSCRNLVSLEGLSGLTDIGGDLTIEGNSALVLLKGLSDLTTIHGDLSIVGNSALVSLEGLSGLTAIHGALSIVGNDKLVSLEGLSGLTNIGGELDIRGSGSLTGLFIYCPGSRG